MSAPTGYKKISALTPDQSGFLQQLMQMLSGMGMQGGQMGIQHFMDILSNKPGAFESFEAPIKRQFQEEIMPGIAEQYAGMGAMNSSAFPMASAQAGRDLSERLASLRSGLQGQAAQGLMGGLQSLGGLGLGTQSFGFQQKAPSFLTSFMGGAGQGGGMESIIKLLSMLVGGK